MMEVRKGRQYRLTLRSLMIVVAVCALILIPLSRSLQRMEQLRLARLRAVLEAKHALELGRKSKAEALWSLQRARALKEATGRNQDAVTEAGPAVTVRNAAKTSTENRWQGKVWAALSVSSSLIRQGEPIPELQLRFTLVNQSSQRIAPRIFESRIKVDGKELAEPTQHLGQTPRTARFKALAPGEGVYFSLPLSLGEDFEEPGEHRVVWEGSGFQSPELLIRVRPKRDSRF